MNLTTLTNSLVLLLIFISTGNAQKFSIIAMPDTQHYTHIEANEDNFYAQTEWIQTSRDALNIVFVTGLGDITQNGNDDDEWMIADAAYSLIEYPETPQLLDGIPYGLSLGNHDMFPIGGGNTANTDKFNEYFGESHFLGRHYYGGHHGVNNDNSFQLFSASGLDFIIIHLEYDTTPEQEVLDWADGVLKTHKNRRAIVTTHHMIGNGYPANFGNQGQAIFNNLKDNENLFLMLGGHVPAEGRRDEVGTNGNPITVLLSDYQSRSMGGTGWLRIMEFDPSNNTIQVKTYSPVLDQFGTDNVMNGNSVSATFTINYDMSNPIGGQTSILQDGLDGYDGTRDTYIFTSNPNTIRGGELTFVQDNESNGDITRTSLLKFDLNTIPADCEILGAQLEFNVDIEGKGFKMHRMLKNWDESTISFTSNGGHFKSNNIDAENHINASWPGVDGYTGPITVQVPPSTIKEWLDGDFPNYGWLMISTDPAGDGQQLSSRESALQGIRPKLTIQYNDPENIKMITYQNGVDNYMGTKDTYTWDAEPNINHGSNQTIVQDNNAEDERKSLLKFDFSTFPDSSRLVSAKLEFSVEVEGQGFTMHQMLKPWNDSDTYNSIGGMHYQANNDDAVTLADASWPGIDNFLGLITVDLDPLLVQSWIDGVEINNGWLMLPIHPDDGQQLASADNNTITKRPKVILEYESCPLSSTFSLGKWSNGRPCITTDAFIEQDYDTSIFGNIDAATITSDPNINFTISSNDHAKAWRE